MPHNFTTQRIETSYVAGALANQIRLLVAKRPPVDQPTLIAMRRDIEMNTLLLERATAAMNGTPALDAVTRRTLEAVIADGDRWLARNPETPATGGDITRPMVGDGR
jgi:hypothetical protein